MFKAILARDDDYGIGKNGGLPWPHIASDMKFFADITATSTIVMGATTWRSIGQKKLVGRRNIVFRSSIDAEPLTGFPDEIYCGDLVKSMIKVAREHPRGDIFIIGGAMLYNEFLPWCTTLYETHISGSYGCDTFIDQKHFDLFKTVAERTDHQCKFMMKLRKPAPVGEFDHLTERANEKTKLEYMGR